MGTQGTIWEDKPPFRPTPSRAALASAGPNIVDRPSYASTGDKKMHDFMAPDELLIGL